MPLALLYGCCGLPARWIDYPRGLCRQALSLERWRRRVDDWERVDGIDSSGGRLSNPRTASRLRAGGRTRGPLGSPVSGPRIDSFARKCRDRCPATIVELGTWLGHDRARTPEIPTTEAHRPRLTGRKNSRQQNDTQRKRADQSRFSEAPLHRLLSRRSGRGRQAASEPAARLAAWQFIGIEPGSTTSTGRIP